jgi:hypothetical protein
MNGFKQRQTMLELIEETYQAGARLKPACALIGLSERTLQR